jgi:uncharacterized protein YodC (DUF2158 family)
MDKLIVGDVVALKSGGPRMTISKIYRLYPNLSDKWADAVWFDKENKFESATFQLSTLEAK